MKEPTDSQIIAALEESGFLFEHSCASALEALGFHVETSWPFADADQPKSRELDLRAFRLALNNEVSKIQVLVELLVECKDYEAPLVFLQRPKNKREQTSPAPNEIRFPRYSYQRKLAQGSFRDEPGFEHFNLAPSHYYHREPVKTTQFVKVVRKGQEWVANHDGVHDALVLPLAKALESRKAEVKQGHPRPGDWASIWLFFPVVLVRNRLLVFDPDSPTSLTERGRVSYVRALDMPPLQGSYLIDFVSFGYIKNYIETEVLSFTEAICELTKANPKGIRGDA